MVDLALFHLWNLECTHLMAAVICLMLERMLLADADASSR